MAKEDENDKGGNEQQAPGEGTEEELTAEGQAFPTYLYHKKHGAKIFHDPKEWIEARKKGWVDSPAKFKGK